MARRNTKLEAEGAEFLVLGHLLVEGIPAYKAYTNHPDYDVVAVWPEANRLARIQVKSRWRKGANSFPIKNFNCDFIVLAQLNRESAVSNSESASFCVLPSTFAYARSQPAGWARSQESTYRTVVWRRGEFDEYKGNWALIRRFLQQAADR